MITCFSTAGLPVPSISHPTRYPIVSEDMASLG
jgi:hypothetical protein